MVFKGEQSVSSGPTLSDSLLRTRPDFKTYMRTDSNANGHDMNQVQQKRLERQIKMPPMTGRHDVDSFKQVQNPADPAFKKFNDEGEYRPPAPFRASDNMIDPVSGFLSASGDKIRNTGHNRVVSMVQLNDTPPSYNPRRLNSVRMNESAPPDTRRESEIHPGAPYPWNGRVMLDTTIRSKLGGWTSARDPRNIQPEKLNVHTKKTGAETARDIRDKLALKFMYTSSSQRAYEEVPWDNMTAKGRSWSHISTLEKRPDMISQAFTNKRYEPAACEWQNTGRSWDWFQLRQPNFKKNIPIPGTNFSSHCKKAQQIPGYGGCIGGENILEIDNPDESFTPFTVQRTRLPWPSDTAHRPNIPRYTGCTLYTDDRIHNPMHSLQQPPQPQTTARVHRPMPIETNLSDYRKRSFMSKMITTVPPSNPFNTISKEAIQAGKVGEGPTDLGQQQPTGLSTHAAPLVAPT